MNSSGNVKVCFHLVQDEDGYPPVSVESVHAKKVGENDYQIDNIPFFAKKISLGDIVTATEENGILWFVSKKRISGYSTIRVVVYNPEAVQQVRDDVARIGCASELSHMEKLIAISIPPEVDYSVVADYLSNLAAQELVDYEEAAIRHKVP